MKNNKIFTWTLILTIPMIFAVLGCNKFLDRKPLQATLNDLHQGQLEGQILNMYTILRTYAGFSTLPWLDFHSIRDDDAQKGSYADDGKEINTEFETFQYNKDDWAINSYWNDHYTMINAANKAIATAQASNVSDPASLRNVGEARFFRAYAYYELVKNFGDVPLIRNQILKPTDGIVPKSTANEIYQFIDSDLTAAAALLPLNSNEYGPLYKGRLTKGAANTLWAQTFLMRDPADYVQVASLTKQVIASGQYSLATNFSDIWRDGKDGAGKNGPESIFEMQATAGQNAANNSAVDYGSFWGETQAVRQQSAPIEWNLGWGWNTPTQNLVSAWPDTDPRKERTILYSGQSDGGPDKGGFGATLPIYTNPDGSGGGLSQPYWNKKIYTGCDPAMRTFTGWINQSGGSYWINHRILRYADVLLMLAEASNESGDGKTAEEMLEKVRFRARAGSTDPDVLPKITFVNQAQMRTAIKNERRWEFAMEGYRFYDLVRWHDADAVLAGLGYTHKARLYPIPQKAIDLSGGVLVQNPEWQ